MGEVRGTRRGGAAALATATILSATSVPALSTREATPLSDASHQSWSGTLEQRLLGDGSTLSAYTATTDALDTPDVRLHVGFVPRFRCEPVIGIRFGGEMASIAEAFFDDGGSVSMAIDGEEARWPLLVDADGTETTLWYDGDAARLAAVRQQFDSGSGAIVALPNEVSMSFSLLGSRRSIADTETACRVHEPAPWRG